MAVFLNDHRLCGTKGTMENAQNKCQQKNIGFFGDFSCEALELTPVLFVVQGLSLSSFFYKKNKKSTIKKNPLAKSPVPFSQVFCDICP